jgi:cardiolipin synthase
MGSGIGSIESAVDSLLRQVHEEVLIAVYSISRNAIPVLERLGELAQTGARVTLVVNQIAKQPGPVRARLRELAGLSCFALYDFAPPDGAGFLHSKVIVVDREMAIVGSSNLSWRGLVANHELGVMLQGDIVIDLAAAIDTLIVTGQQSGTIHGPLGAHAWTDA